MKLIILIFLLTIFSQISHAQFGVDRVKNTNCQVVDDSITAVENAIGMNRKAFYDNSIRYCYESDYYFFYQIVFTGADPNQYGSGGYIGDLVYTFFKNNYLLDLCETDANGFVKIMVFKKYKKEDQIMLSLETKIEVLKKELNTEISNSLKKVPEGVQAEWSKIIGEKLDTILDGKLNEIKSEILKTINSKPTDNNEQ